MMSLSPMLRTWSRFIASPGKYCSNINNASQINRLSTINSDTSSIGEVINYWSRRFEDDGIPEPIESIEHVVAHIIGTRKIMDLVDMRERKLTAQQLVKLESLCQCRLSRMPVQYIIGEWDFRELTLKLVPPVFIPRPETELLIDFILKYLSSENLDDYRILDVGCGSGAISLALAHSSSKIHSVAIDVNVYACDLTRENRNDLNLKDRVTIVNAMLNNDGTIKVLDDTENSIDFDKEQFDFIVSNPPYVPTSQIFELAPEIKIYEDLRALDGGDDGLTVIKPLLKYATKTLKPGGRLFIEVDPGHPEYIQFYTKKYPNLLLKYERTYKDYCNNNRFVEILKLH